MKSCQTQKETRRSKNEIAFCELCEKYFKNVKHNERIFNGWDADIIIEDYKIAVLWNGKWHYEKITKNHYVEQVQNRDKIKIEEIKKAGYVPYIIKDVGKYNINKVKNEFNLFLENVLLRDSLKVRYWAHNPGTDNACDGPTPSPATNLIGLNVPSSFYVLTLTKTYMHP